MVDFLFVKIELLQYLLRLRHYKRKSVEVGVFWRGWVTLSTNFRRKGVRSQKTKVTDCPIVWYKNICSALFGFVTKHVCERQTDRQNYDSQDRTSIAAHAVKTDRCKSYYSTLNRIRNYKMMQQNLHDQKELHYSTITCNIQYKR